MPTPLTALLPLREGSEETLRSVLREVGNDVAGRRLAERPGAPFIDFGETPTHFARLVVIPDPQRGPERHRLLFAAIHDGSPTDFLETVGRATLGEEAIWGACETYPGRSGFADWVRAHTVETEGYYMAFRRHSLAHVRRLSHEADAFDEAVGDGRISPHAESGPMDRGLPGLRRLLRGLAWAPVMEVEALRMLARHGLRNTFRAGLEISASLDRIRLLRWINRLTGNTMAPLSTAHSEVTLYGCDPCRAVSEEDEVVDPDRQWALQRVREDRVAQNQLTLVTVNDPERVRRVAAVMGLLGFYSRWLSPPGSLVGISTIHFVRWAIIDEGRRLLMISDYDGSWEAYIEEFAEMILSGLDAIWAGSVGYPKAGARDVQAFKRFLRCRQYQAEVFYSGYPGETVLNLRSHAEQFRWRRRILAKVATHD